MTRDEMNARVLEFKNMDFQNEISHFLSVDDREYAYDPVFALLDAEAMEGQSNKVIKICRTLLIEFGFYRPMDDEEIQNTYVSGGRSPWIFKLNGIPYTSDELSSDWEDGAIEGDYQ